LKVALPARAKLNLDLQVIKRREDGFHEIRTHMQSVALHDLLEASLADRTSLTADGMLVPAGEDNVILKALAALERASGRELPTRFQLHKRVPPGAGLGGASSDAATALRAVKMIHAVDIDLSKVARGVGADVPFFLAGGLALAEGAGELLTPLPVEPCWYAIAWPGIELSTASVYGAWDKTRGAPPNELFRAAAAADVRLQEFADSLGPGWQMTGSGSAFFKRFSRYEEAMGSIQSLDCWTAATHTVGPWS
jgi:4-diphosphocytidyl-2-C-methyl-D-erythritol kinase